MFETVYMLKIVGLLLFRYLWQEVIITEFAFSYQKRSLKYYVYSNK